MHANKSEQAANAKVSVEPRKKRRKVMRNTRPMLFALPEARELLQIHLSLNLRSEISPKSAKCGRRYPQFGFFFRASQWTSLHVTHRSLPSCELPKVFYCTRPQGWPLAHSRSLWSPPLPAPTAKSSSWCRSCARQTQGLISGKCVRGEIDTRHVAPPFLPQSVSLELKMQ